MQQFEITLVYFQWMQWACVRFQIVALYIQCYKESFDVKIEALYWRNWMWCDDVGVWRMWSIEPLLCLLWTNQSSRDVNVAIMSLTTSRPPPPTICLQPGSIIWMVITCLTPSPGLQPATFREARVNADSLWTFQLSDKGEACLFIYLSIEAL